MAASAHISSRVRCSGPPAFFLIGRPSSSICPQRMAKSRFARSLGIGGGGGDGDIRCGTHTSETMVVSTPPDCTACPAMTLSNIASKASTSFGLRRMEEDPQGHRHVDDTGENRANDNASTGSIGHVEAMPRLLRARRTVNTMMTTIKKYTECHDHQRHT